MEGDMRKKLVFILLLAFALAILSPYNLASKPNKCDEAFARCMADVDFNPNNYTLILEMGFCAWGWAFCMKYLPKQ
jgi:hypothetical protein